MRKVVRTIKGFVVIDDKSFPISIGGIRLIAGVNEREVELLAESMSQKLHILNIPMSGAKGGIDSDDINDFFDFVGEIASLIRGDDNHTFITGPDIGTSEEEYYEALRKHGLDEFIRPGLLSRVSQVYSLPLDNIVTAYGALVCAEELLRRDKNEDPLEGRKLAIEGFGKVGTGIAAIVKNRVKVVAISTRYGMIEDQNGLDIDKLLQLREKHGDNLVYEYGVDVKDTEELFGVKCDILIPGARTQVVTREIANRIRDVRPIIVPVSNSPFTKEGLEILENSGITCFPDFVASAGAIIAAMGEFAGCKSEDNAMEIVRLVQQSQTRDLLRGAKACGVPTSIYQFAKNTAEQNKELLKENNEVNVIDVAKSFCKQNSLQHLLN